VEIASVLALLGVESLIHMMPGDAGDVSVGISIDFPAPPPAIYAPPPTIYAPPPSFTRLATITRLWLPLIRLIGLRSPPEVFVIKPTDTRHRHHPALARLLHPPPRGCVFRQG
jgi:hypothetical protein